MEKKKQIIMIVFLLGMVIVSLIFIGLVQNCEWKTEPRYTISKGNNLLYESEIMMTGFFCSEDKIKVEENRNTKSS